KVKSRKGAADIESVRHMSAAMSAAQRFQGAYRAADKPILKEVCTPRFYNGSLATADLSSVTLPDAAGGMDDFNVKLEGAGATFRRAGKCSRSACCATPPNRFTPPRATESMM